MAILQTLASMASSALTGKKNQTIENIKGALSSAKDFVTKKEAPVAYSERGAPYSPAKPEPLKTGMEKAFAKVSTLADVVKKGPLLYAGQRAAAAAPGTIAAAPGAIKSLAKTIFPETSKALSEAQKEATLAGRVVTPIKAAKAFATDVAKTTIGAGLRTAASLQQTGVESGLLKERTIRPEENVAGRFLIGEEPIKSFTKTIGEESGSIGKLAEASAKSFGASKEASSFAGKVGMGLAAPIFGGLELANLDLGVGGIGKKAIKEVAEKATETLAQKAARAEAAKALKKESEGYLSSFISSEAGANLTKEKQAALDALQNVPQQNDRLISAVRNSPAYKKEKSVQDWMTTGVMMEKNGKEIIVKSEDVAKYSQLGYSRSGDVDNILTGFRRENPTLAEKDSLAVLEEQVGLPEQVSSLKKAAAADEKKLAHEYLLQNDPAYKQMVEQSQSAPKLTDAEELAANWIGQAEKAAKKDTERAAMEAAAKDAKARKDFIESLGKDIETGIESEIKGAVPGANRNQIINLIKNGTDLDTVAKVRSRGDGTILLRKDAFDVVRSMPEVPSSALTDIFKTPERLFSELGETARELFWRPMVKAFGAEAKAQKAAEEAFVKLTQGLEKNSSERIMLYAMSQESDAAKTLGKGFVVPKLSTKEKAVYDAVRTKYDTLLDGLNKVRAMTGAEPIKKRTNYFTHLAELSELDKFGINLATDKDIAAQLSKFSHRITTPFQFARERTGGANVILDAFGAFRKYETSAIKNIALTPTASSLRLMLEDVRMPDGSVFSLKKESPNTYQAISNWLDFSMGKKPVIGDAAIEKTASKIEGVVNSLMKRVQVARLAGNLSSALVQMTAFRNSIIELGWKPALKGIGELASKGSAEALSKSNVLLGRLFDVSLEDAQKLSKKGILGYAAKIDSMIAETGSKIIKNTLGFIDSKVATATWYGAYEDALAKGMGEARAINFADDVVIRTQGSASKYALAPIQRRTLGKAMTQFQTFVINDLNFLYEKIPGAFKKGDKKGAIKNLANTLLIGAMMNEAYTQGGLQAPFPELYQKTKEGYEKGGISGAAGGFVKETLGALPVIGGAAKFYRPGASVIESVPVVGEFAKLHKAVTEKTPEEAAIQAGVLAGIPGMSQAKKTLSGIRSFTEPTKVYGGAGGGRTGEVVISGTGDKVRAALSGPYGTKTYKTEEQRLNKIDRVLAPQEKNLKRIKERAIRAVTEGKKDPSILKDIEAHNKKTTDNIISAAKSGIFKGMTPKEVVALIKKNTITTEELIRFSVNEIKKDVKLKKKMEALSK